MFTVKVIEQDETGIAAEQVLESSGVRTDRERVYVDLDEGQATYDFRSLQGGLKQTMFVMNRFGATVATYHL